MLRKIKLLFLVVLIICGVLFNKALLQNVEAQTVSKEESKLDQIISRGYIEVGVTGDYKPFSYVNPANKEYEGYDVDAMREFAKSL